jgi:hypothetical protein
LIDEGAQGTNGEVLVVHPSVPEGGQVEPLDPTGRFDYLGLWSEERADDTVALVDGAVAAVASGASNGWSGI